MDYLDQAIKGIFLLVLAVCGNFVAETMGCKSQRLLSKNMIAKHFITFLLLFFAIDFTTTQSDDSPLDTLKLSSIIYIFFILFTKMNLVFTVLVFLMLTIVYIIGLYIEYYSSHDEEDHNGILVTLKKTKKFLYSGIIGMILLGFGLYFIKQRNEHKKNWSTIKFILGTPKCDSMK